MNPIPVTPTGEACACLNPCAPLGAVWYHDNILYQCKGTPPAWVALSPGPIRPQRVASSVEALPPPPPTQSFVEGTPQASATPSHLLPPVSETGDSAESPVLSYIKENWQRILVAAFVVILVLLALKGLRRRRLRRKFPLGPVFG